MKSIKEANIMTSDTRRPFDYGGDKMAVYFEVADMEKALSVVEMIPYKGLVETSEVGFTIDIAAQQIPEVIRTLVDQNIAIYGVMPQNLDKIK